MAIVPDVERLLWDVVRDIEPTPNQIAAASGSHRYLRDLLNGGNIGRRIADSYLGGSYSRDTAIRPIDDVDVIFVVDPAGWDGPRWSGLPSPQAVLNTFANAIRYRYPLSSVYGQRRSVRLQLSHLDIDVVPAVIASADGTALKIPDADADEWLLTAPKLHARNATDVNAARNGVFKPLVKLLKYWNGNLPEPARLKSFTVETMAVRIFKEVQCSDLRDGLLKFLDFCARLDGQTRLYSWASDFGMSFGLFGISVPDAAGTASNTAHGVDATRIEKLSSRAAVSLERIGCADRARLTEAARTYVQEALRV